MNRPNSRIPLIKMVILAVIVSAISAIVAVNLVHAYPQDLWTVQSGEQLEVLRDYVCFGEGRAGEREITKGVTFSRDVLSAEVFISGFNMWYTKEGHDHEVSQLRVDAWVYALGVGKGCGSEPETRCTDPPDPKNVGLRFMYAMTDENTGDDDDFNDACIGFTVLARTK